MTSIPRTTAIHTDGSIAIESGAITISSGDDGIHADSALIISGGEIRIEKSYEGLEAARVGITDGTIYVTASDDGINAGGGNNSSSPAGRPGQGTFAAQTDVEICITGGYIEIDASGDGVDSNGNLYVEGACSWSAAPKNNGNGALDYNGTASITGGMVIAAGSSGMAENFGSASSQCSILYAFDAVQEGGTRLTLCDEDGNVLLSWAPEKAFQTVVLSTPGLLTGSSYQILTGGTIEDADASALFAPEPSRAARLVRPCSLTPRSIPMPAAPAKPAS